MCGLATERGRWNLPLGLFVFFQNKRVGYNQSGFVAGEKSTCLLTRLGVQEKGGVCRVTGEQDRRVVFASAGELLVWKWPGRSSVPGWAG